MRTLLLILVPCLFLTACDPAAVEGIAISPQPSVAADSAGQVAFAVAARISARHDVPALVPLRAGMRGYHACFARDTFFLCGKRVGGETQFHAWQRGRFSFSPRADSVIRELLDSLRSEFGSSNVRTCEWRPAEDLHSKSPGACRPKPDSK